MGDMCMRCGDGPRQKRVEVDTGWSGVESVGVGEQYGPDDVCGYVCGPCAAEIIQFINGDD